MAANALDWDQRVASSSLIAGGVTVLCPYPLHSTCLAQGDGKLSQHNSKIVERDIKHQNKISVTGRQAIWQTLKTQMK